MSFNLSRVVLVTSVAALAVLPATQAAQAVAGPPEKAAGAVGAPTLLGSSLDVDEKLEADDYLRSPNQRYRLYMQKDGNLVVRDGEQALWESRTAGAGSFAYLQKDGNLVVRSASGKALWTSRTSGTGVRLTLRDDGDVVIRSSSGKALWSWKSTSWRLATDESLKAGDYLRSLNRKYLLHMQADGNLVLLNEAKRVLWDTETGGNPSAFAYLQKDGNLVVRSTSGKALWSSGKSAPGGTLYLQDDGNLVIRTVDGEAAWTR
ncbi:bulb-type lectin domain-containing protein [Streptosporangium sp. V21-05]|uniref:bulb-type lectin domain-containing protein n=1 Tax=Streptosporangium sp. V21-05 TaxID=3446115 RepID=UPI003F5353C5